MVTIAKSTVSMNEVIRILAHVRRARYRLIALCSTHTSTHTPTHIRTYTTYLSENNTHDPMTVKLCGAGHSLFRKPCPNGTLHAIGSDVTEVTVCEEEPTSLETSRVRSQQIRQSAQHLSIPSHTHTHTHTPWSQIRYHHQPP